MENELLDKISKAILTMSIEEQMELSKELDLILYKSRIERDCLNCSAGGKSINSTVLS